MEHKVVTRRGLLLWLAGLAAPSLCVAQVSLLTNGGFESGSFQGWTLQGNGIVTTNAARTGRYGASLTNANLRQGWINLSRGRTYKAFAWIRLVTESGSDWGGFRVEVNDENWKTLAHSGELLIRTHGTNWFKVALKFTASSSRVLVQVGYFGGGNRTLTAFVDDCTLVEDIAGNLPPEISASLNPTNVTAPATQLFTLTGDDPDGAIRQVMWDFGDGSRAFGWVGRRHVGVPGNYVARVIVVDDEGLSVTQRVSWTAVHPAFPSLEITKPELTSLATDQPLLELNGTATGATVVCVSTDRGVFGTANGTTNWNFALQLQPGWNHVTVQAHDVAGRVVTEERHVRFLPLGPLEVTDITQSAQKIERWEPLEITFQLLNSAATHPQFPYDSNPPPGLHWVDGVTVDGVFTPDNWKTVYRRPAFLWQQYLRAKRNNEEWLYPTNAPRWCVRFAPPEVGAWLYRIEVAEARGSAVSDVRTFEVAVPTSAVNHGPIKVSATDKRYFEFADGTPFLGAGHGVTFSAESYSYDAEDQFTKIGNGNQNFFRWWIAGHLWGSAWQPWNSRTLPYEGTVPATGLALDAAYGDGLACWRLDSTNPILFQGWMSGHAGLVQGRTYRVRVRWRTDNVTGPVNPAYPYGVCVKITGWPEPGRTLTLPAVVRHVYGDTPWHVATGTFTANSPLLDNLSIILENASSGSAYIDECALEELYSNGACGPNLLRSPRANSHLTFDPRRGAGVDHILRVANDRGLYFKLVISEKQEYLLNHFSPTGLPDPQGGHFNRGPGSPTCRLHEYYWRHLSARFGAFRAVHSWELVNEEAPGPGEHFELTAHAAQLADTDGNPHLVSTSTWAGLATNAWLAPASAPIHYVDFHCYVRNTGWIEPKDALAKDSARFFAEYDRAAISAGFDKPVVWGEMGIDGPATTDDEEPYLARDTHGVWLHKIVWARCGPGGVYPLYWWTDNIFKKNLHSLFGNWSRFMAGIPLNNGRYRDASAVSSNPAIRVLGQKDVVAGRAHLWLDNSNHTWRTVVDGRQSAPQTVTIRINVGAGGSYRLTWWNTTDGTSFAAELLEADANGNVSFSVTNLLTDIGVRLERLQPREAWRLEYFGTPSSSGDASDDSDPDHDGLANWIEYAFGLNPLAPSRLPVWASLRDGRPAIGYVRRRPPTDVEYFVESAPHVLGIWSDRTILETVLGTSGLWQTNLACDAIPLVEQDQRFLRLKIKLIQ